MKKICLCGLIALSTICLVGCKEQQVDTDLAQSIQKNRENLTQSEAYAWGDFYDANINVLSLVLTSNNVQMEYDGLPFSNYAGTGYAFNVVLLSDMDAADLLAPGIYTQGDDQLIEAYTYDASNTYLTVLNGDAATKLLFREATFTVDVEDDQYTIAIQATTILGAAIKATFKGELDAKSPYAFRESTTPTEQTFEATEAYYAPSESNKADWAQDSAYSYYVEVSTYYADTYAKMADEYYSYKTPEDTLIADSLYYIALGWQDDADYYAESKELGTPLNAHYFTLYTDNGDEITLEIDLMRLDPEYTEIIPDGQYAAAEGVSYMEDINWLWTDKFNDPYYLYGSYIMTADGQFFYIYEAEVNIDLDEYGNVLSLQLQGTTQQGSTVQVSYEAE